MSWRRFNPEGCQGKIEGIEGPRSFMGKIEGIEGRALESLSCGSQDREQIEREDCAQMEDKTSCLLPLGNRTHACSYNAGSGPIHISIVTLGGQELSINGCTGSTTIGDVKVMLQEMSSGTSDELILLLGGDILDMAESGRERTIHDLGLDVPGVCLCIIRRQSRESLNQMLVNALESGRDDEARDLIDRGAGFDSEGNPALFMGSTMLHLALRTRLEDLALLVIKSGADIHTENESGRRPLAIAAMKGLGRIVKALVDAGADPYHRDKFHHLAKYHGSSSSAFKQARENGSFHLLDRFCAE